MVTGLRERANAWTLSRQATWHPMILWYERAFGVLQANGNLADPRSLLGIANIHGTSTPRSAWPAAVGARDWNACQHGSWFFLPWHRMYLHYFEAILRDIIGKAGGPSDWALPFWSYDPSDLETLAIPPAFLVERTPTGEANALFSALRDPEIKKGEKLDAGDVGIGGWESVFATASPLKATFGGPEHGWHHNAGTSGHLEREPHATVHVDVGGDGGLMSAFETAAQDPIFWLHHANIDRLWELWRNEPGHADPTDGAWTSGAFEFGYGPERIHLTVEEMLDTSTPLLGYQYAGVSVVVPPAADAAGKGLRPEGVVAGVERTPEVVGAAEGVTVLGPTSIAVEISPPAGPLGLVGAEPASHAYLALQNVRGTGLRTRTYTVHVGRTPSGTTAPVAEYLAGRFSTFGVMEATRRASGETGDGLTFSFDITPIVDQIAMGSGDRASLVTVTIAPQGPLATGAETSLDIGGVSILLE